MKKLLYLLMLLLFTYPNVQPITTVHKACAESAEKCNEACIEKLQDKKAQQKKDETPEDSDDCAQEDDTKPIKCTCIIQ